MYPHRGERRASRFRLVVKPRNDATRFVLGRFQNKSHAGRRDPGAQVFVRATDFALERGAERKWRVCERGDAEFAECGFVAGLRAADGESCSHVGSWWLEESSGARLVLEQPLFAFEAAAVAGERTVSADHAMAGHDDADGIRTVGEADGANSFRPANLFGELAVGDRRAAGNCAERAPDFLLEVGAASFHGDGVDGGEFAAEVAIDRARDGGFAGRAVE